MIRCFAFLIAAALTLSAAELPVSRVVLYKNGLALFERSGAVKPGEPVRLEFKKSEMDDVLKTLVLTSSAGAVTHLRYELDEPLDRRLADIGLSIPNGVNLATLLDQMRGARIVLGTTGGPVEGVIVSGRIAQQAQQAQKLELTFLTTAGELRIIDLDGVSSVKLADDRLQKRLTEALGAYQQAQSQERKSLWVETSGATGTLLARYLVPAPMWKSAYRLAFTDKDDATIEGWAIVENKSDSDWNNVQLTVVSGQPISFISRLYEPKYVQRQDLEPAENVAQFRNLERNAAPQASQKAARDAFRNNARQQNLVQMNAPMAAPASAVGGVMERVEVTSAEVASSVEPETEAQEVGELFEYHFSRPASVKAGESLLLPFVQQKIAARQVYIWDRGEGVHPQRAAKLTNSTGKTLDGGPVTVYTPEGYTGESLMSTFKAGDKRFLSFAIDLGTRITTKYDTGAQVIRSVKAERGVITTKSVLEQRTTYTVVNVDSKEKALLISHPVAGDGELISPKPEEKSDQRYLFAVTAPAAGSTSLTVVEQQPLEESVSIMGLNADQIVAWIAARKLSSEARQKLETLAAKKRDLSDASALIQQIEARINALSADEGRLRQNIQSLNYVASQKEQVERWAADLAKKEVAIIDQQTRLDDARKKKAALESELAQLVEKLSF
ncbi:MAG: DUF4139 domain-containing protein [Bryobacteraceae bacterium]|jgi:hypothetical protein